MTNTTFMFRNNIQPGMLVKHDGKAWRASANVAKGLYLDSPAVKTRVTAEVLEVFIDAKGRPVIH
ncbi:cell division protein FtsZ [Pantoea agglomerans]|jgi:hypothetical protein|uniref:cell division protein FtsZ n=1 Tax=Enterobacter agglomerans TaxID=549 RepID=UPI003C7EB89B